MNNSAVTSRKPTPVHLSVAIAVALAAWSGSADAAGLGRLSVSSALGQPLQAEVEVTSVSPEEAATLAARLASPDAFRAAGLQFNNALAGVRMSVQERSGRHFVRVTSSNPINEPFVDLMVELNWASGKFVREYTFLLDPPEMRASRQTVEGGGSASTVAPATSARSTQPSRNADTAQNAPGAARSASQPSPAQPATAQRGQPAGRAAASGGSEAAGSGGSTTRSLDAARRPAAGGGSAAAETVMVARGDTLGKIAASKKPIDATLEQTIVAIYQANRSAFIDDNPNLIRQGRRLSIPDAGAIAAIDAASAQRQLRVAAQDFRAYKDRLSGTTPQVASGSTGTTASGSVAAQVEDRAARPAVSDRLELSKSAGEAGGAAGAIGSRDAEARIARDAALTESNSRIAELERNVADLQKMVELKNRSLSDLQAQLDQQRASGAAVSGAVGAAGGAAANAANAAKAANASNPSGSSSGTTPPAGAGGTAGSPSAPSSSPSAAGSSSAAPSAAPSATPSSQQLAADGRQGASPPSGSPASTPSVPSAGTTPPGPSAAAPATPAPFPATDAGAAAPVPGSLSPSAGGTTPTPAPATPSPAPVALAPSSVAAQESMLEEMLDNPMLLPALGGLALLGGFGLWMGMRRRKVERFEDSLIAADAFTANSLFGTTGGQSVDTATGSIQTQVTTMSEASPTEVDPIAEADVYIAYGREAQAEEILKEALKRQHERQAIRLKLLEIYSGRRDAQSFESVARDMYGMTGGQNEEWPKVAAMGLALNPNNPLYSGGSAQSAGGSAGRVAAATSIAAASAAAFGAPANRSPEAAPARGFEHGREPGREPAQTRQPDEIADLDFNLDLDRSLETAAARSEHGFGDGAADFAQSRSGPLSAMPNVDLPSLDLDFPAPTAPVRNQPSRDFNVEVSSREGLNPRPAPSHEAAGASEMDLSSIGLDLSPSTLTGPSTITGPGNGQWQEMASKLDLASAYGEIGDKEGARELLQEVVKGGDPSQQQKARELLASI